jgi:hypothetical protein
MKKILRPIENSPAYLELAENLRFLESPVGTHARPRNGFMSVRNRFESKNVEIHFFS